MNGERPNIFFKICWYGVTPAFILIIWGFNWYFYEPVKYGNSYTFGTGPQTFGWFIAMISIVSIPLGAIHTFANAPGKTFKKKFFYSIRPSILDLDQVPSEKKIPNNQMMLENISANNRIEPTTNLVV